MGTSHAHERTSVQATATFSGTTRGPVDPSPTPLHPGLPAPDGSTDPHAWLEDVLGEDQLAWVRERNARTEAELDAHPLTSQLETEIRDILDAKDKIPAVSKLGEYLYNFWQDADHERGLWRRTTVEQFRTDEPQWEILIDVDALNEREGEDWVWHGAQALRPRDGEPYRRFLVSLSHGGSDADVTREWDLETREFVSADNGGFVKPEAKGALSWVDEDTVLIATDFGEETMTTSGYPRQARLWTRGQALADAELLFEAAREDMGVFAGHDQTPGWERSYITVMHTFYTSSTYLVQREKAQQPLLKLDVPEDVLVGVHRDLMIVQPREDWSHNGHTYPAGSLLVADVDAFVEGSRDLHVLFAPTERSSLVHVSVTRNYVVATILEDVKHRLEVYYRNAEGAWTSQDLLSSVQGAVSVNEVDSEASDELWVHVTDFVTPPLVALTNLEGVREGESTPRMDVLKRSPERFDASGVQVSQHFAISDDGTRIPYFQIGNQMLEPEEAAQPRPTLLYGYGGFEIPLTPNYLGASGKAWVERGGVLVVANIRGGGEYGPRWHQAGVKAQRHRVYEDFSSVARDLIARGVTDSSHLGVQGGSNGGLLTGNMLSRYPHLFGAVIIQVPLLDMKRFSHLLAGASWIAEYGDPDTQDWDFIQGFSPYHQLDPHTTYPPTFVLTSTRDDRVHPAHARKLTAALEAIGANVRAWENIEGGHGGAASNAQAARMNALIFSFLWSQLKQRHS